MLRRLLSKVRQPGFAIVVSVALFALSFALPTGGKVGHIIHIVLVVFAAVMFLAAAIWLIGPWGLPTQVEGHGRPVASVDQATGNVTKYEPSPNTERIGASPVSLPDGKWGIHVEVVRQPVKVRQPLKDRLWHRGRASR